MPRGRSAPTEIKACKTAGINFIELPDRVRRHRDRRRIPKATWINDITVDELKTLWAPEAQGKVMRWNQVRTGWPDREIHLFGAGVDSGTYDYFTEAINGKAKASRGDFTSSEDDNVLVQGVAGDELALGFIPFAYYEREQEAAEAHSGGRQEGGERRTARSRPASTRFGRAPINRWRGRCSSTCRRRRWRGPRCRSSWIST